MTDSAIRITTVTIRVPVKGQVLEAPDVGVLMEIYSDQLRVWDQVNHTDCGESYMFDPSRATGIYGRRTLTDIPFFSTVFKAVSEHHAANCGNPLGGFIRPAVEAMEAALASRDGSRVYFARAGDRVKIGWSKRVGSRIAELQTGNSEPIELLGVIPGGRLSERQLHDQFAHLRVSGEWFEATPELLAFVEQAAT